MAYTTISVSDLGVATKWFQDKLGMDLVEESDVDDPALSQLYDLEGARVRRAVVRLPVGSDIHLEQHLAHQGEPVAANLQQYDFGFIHLDLAAHGLAETWARFEREGVRTHCEIQVNKERGNRCFSFEGPDGLRLETHESGDPDAHAWIPNVAPDQPFYAFVHTALSVADQGSTLRLYRDLLGLPIIRESHLEGTRFDHMDGCNGGVAKNCVVRGEVGSEVQFIWHHAGAHHRQGRPVGRLMRQCDLGIVNIAFTVDDIRALRDRLVDERVLLVSDIIADGSGSEACSFRDPDGNLLLAHQA